MAESFPTPAQVAAEQIIKQRQEIQKAHLGEGDIPQEVSLGAPENSQSIGQPVTTESVIAAQQGNAQTPQNENRGYRALRPHEIVRDSINHPQSTGLGGRLPRIV